MHALESYALNSAAKISRPYIFEKYFPTVLDKYITLDCDARAPSKHYDFWQEVVDILGPVLAKQNIVIAQIGLEDDPIMHGVYSAKGQTTLNQRAYIIRNGLLHLGPDNISVDMASHYDKKIVALYGNCLPSHFKPFWSKDSRVSLLEPKRKATKPCYSFTEDPKSINEISPKEIAKEACRLLNVEFDFPYSYSYIGERYHEPKINLIPDAPITAYEQIAPLPTSIRMDLVFNEQALASTLQAGQFQIVTDQPLNPQLIGTFRNKISNLIYIIEENNEPNFVKFLMNSATPYTLVSYMDLEKLAPIKLNYMDLGVIQVSRRITKEETLKKCKEKPTHYKSNKFVLSNGKIYPSQAAWKRGISIPHFMRSSQVIIDDPFLWEESDNYCFLTK
jgi:hypothetical protein